MEVQSADTKWENCRKKEEFGVYLLPVHAKMGLHLVLRPRRKLVGFRGSLPSSDDIFMRQFSPVFAVKKIGPVFPSG